MGLVQFMNLDEMVAELTPGQVVRVESLEIMRGVSKQGISVAELGVHVRAFNDDGHVLSCCLPIRQTQMICGKPLGAEEEHRQAWDEAMALAVHVRLYLGNELFNVRSGVIDIGEAKLLTAYWSGTREGYK